jgi:hypothetical protein
MPCCYGGTKPTEHIEHITTVTVESTAALASLLALDLRQTQAESSLPSFKPLSPHEAGPTPRNGDSKHKEPLPGLPCQS